MTIGFKKSHLEISTTKQCEEWIRNNPDDKIIVKKIGITTYHGKKHGEDTIQLMNLYYMPHNGKMIEIRLDSEKKIEPYEYLCNWITTNVRNHNDCVMAFRQLWKNVDSV